MKFKTMQEISKVVGLIIGTAGIIAGFWDKLAGVYFVALGLWLYLVCGGKEK